jgi:hypothetical protein
MISLCTVVDKVHHDYYKMFAKSLLVKSCLIQHVYVAMIQDKPTEAAEQTETIQGVTFHHFPLYVERWPHWISYKHAIGLHECIKRVSTPYIMFADCDVLFLYPKFDEYCLKVFQDNNLNILGTQMYKMWIDSNYKWCAGHFPFIHFCLMKTDTLPDEKMFKGKLQVLAGEQIVGCSNPIDRTLVNNYYLTCGCIPEFKQLYPNPDGHYDTGCKLYVWNQMMRGRWVSFAPGWLYAEMANWTANIPKVVMPPPTHSHLLYHQGNSTKHKHIDHHTDFRRTFLRYFTPLHK